MISFVLRKALPMSQTKHLSRCMIFPTMWYVRPAKPQISLRIHAVWSEPLLVAWVFFDCKATDWTPFRVSKLKPRLKRIVGVYTCQNVKLLEISCRGSLDLFSNKFSHGDQSEIVHIIIEGPKVNISKVWSFLSMEFVFIFTNSVLMTTMKCSINYLSNDVVSRSKIMPCVKINKPLVIHRFWQAVHFIPFPLACSQLASPDAATFLLSACLQASCAPASYCG